MKLHCFALLLLGVVACGPASRIQPKTGATLNPVSQTALDATPKQDMRLVPPEAYVRSYLQLFGGLAPVDVQARARGADGGQLFDAWDDYLAALGFPDYKLDLPRATQTNAIMVATFERLGVALCDRALEHDWKQSPMPAQSERVVFAFDPAPKPSEQEFATRFDVMHRTFLSYPASLAPGRTSEFYSLFRDIQVRHAAAKQKSRLSPEEAGWVAVCYGLVRHPEFHLY